MEKKIKLVCFDLDKTLITQNSWYKLNLALGVTHEEDQKLLEDYQKGVLSYDDWTKKLLSLFKRNDNSNLNNITKCLSDYTFNIGAKEIVEYVKSKGYIVTLISGSIDILVDLVSRDLNIEYAQATNTFLFDKNDNLNDIITIGDDKLAKLNILESFCRKTGINIDECVCIGDGDNDIELFKKTEHGITFKDSKIEKDAWKVISSLNDLKEIL